MSASAGRGHDYKAKCKQVERKIKEMIFLNAALENELRECKQNVLTSRSDRKILLNKLLSYEKIENGHAEAPVTNGTSSKKSSSKGNRTTVRGESCSSKRKKVDPVAPAPESSPTVKQSPPVSNFPIHV